jgi:UDP-N-acetylglucosamine--N-acetylmuramyl-(pentapeptide) pyrophosphoryl-undecaprenol N-acetylglucosamine transferase
MQEIRILVTGGGSSGHVSPALAVIEAIRVLAEASGRAWRAQFLYIGGRKGIEQGLVERAGLPFMGIATGKLRRYLSLENLTDMARVPLGALQALGALRRFRPHVLLSTGGYVCVPPVLAAALLRVPIITHEQTVQVGLANRIAARYATRIALSFPQAAQELPPRLRARTFVTGNPLRPAIFGGDPAEGARLAGFAAEDAGLPALYITGGSQGARVINRAVEEALPELLARCRAVHQCGVQPAGEEQDYERLQRAAGAVPPSQRRRYHPTRFVRDEIGHIFALADLVLGRAGAGTVAEVCALGKPAVYVPLVPTGGDEQTRNARAMADAGAAITISQSELSGPRLLAALDPLLADPARLAAMGRAALTLARPNAARELAEAVVALGRGQ